MGRNNLRQAFSQLDLSKKDKDYLIPAVLGFMIAGVRTVDVPQRPGYVYARIRSNLNEVVQVWNDKVSPVYDLPVLLVRDPNNASRYKIEGRDTGRYDNWGSTSSYLPRHGNQHSFNPESGGGGDITWVYGRQFMPLALYPSGSHGANNALLGQSAYYYGNSWRYAGGTGTSDLLVYKPTGAWARMVLIALDPNGNPTLSAGDYFAASITGQSAVMPYIPLPGTTDLPIGAARLVSGTSVILWDNLYDLRPLMIAGYSTVTGSSGGHTIQDDGVDLPDRANLNFVGDGFVVYDGGTATIVSGTAGSGGGSLATLSDVTLTSPSDYQMLAYSTGTSKWVNRNLDFNLIRMYDASALITRTFPATDAGLLDAFNLLGSYDVLWLPPGSFSAPVKTFPDYVKIIGAGMLSTILTVVTGATAFTLGTGVVLADFQLQHTVSMAAETVAISAGGNCLLENVYVYESNGNTTGTAYALANAGTTKGFNCYLNASVNATRRNPPYKTDRPWGMHVWEYPTGSRFVTVNDSARFGTTDANGVILNASGIFFQGPGRNHMTVSAADVSSPPTLSQLTGAYGNPTAVGSGFFALLNDAGSGTSEYLIVCDGNNYWYTTLTEAGASDGVGTGSAHVIQFDGTPLTQRGNLNFVGAGFAVYDDSVNNATVVSGTASGMSTGTSHDAVTVSGTSTIGLSLSGQALSAVLNNTAVTPGTYANATITVDQQGRLTAASSGTALVPVIHSDQNVSNPPTESELIAAFGSPDTQASNFMYLLDDCGSGSSVYLAAAVGGHWWFSSITRSANATVVVGVSGTSTIATDADQWFGRATIADLGEGDWILCYYEATSHTSMDGVIHIRFTENYGATWSNEDQTLASGTVTGFPMYPTGAAPADPFCPIEPLLYVAPNGNILIHMWKYDAVAPSAGGTWQAVSTDNGQSWSTPAQISFVDVPDIDRVYSTDDYFVFDGVIYAGARQWETDDEGDGEKSILISSDDSGVTWTRVSDITSFTDGTVEAGLEYLGNNTILAILRDHYITNTATYKRISTDMGATWGTLEEVQSTLGLAGRPRIMTRSHVKGYDNWWRDRVLIMTGFVMPTTGADPNRRNAVWISQDAGATWDRTYIDDEVDDAGYASMAYDATNNRYVVVSYQGSFATADLVQYNLAIGGI